jgi:SH3-like domain-containing protein
MRAGLIAAVLVAFAVPGAAQDRAVPYWVSTKSGAAMMRKGPAENYPGMWLYKRKGLPLRVVKLHENWRMVEDPEGIRGWMLVSLLTERRTAIIKPGEPRPLYAEASESSRVKYRAEPGVVGRIEKCRDNWCKFAVGNRQGYVRIADIWGVGNGENVE